MFVNASDSKAFCEALLNAAKGENTNMVLSGEQFSMSQKINSVQIRKQRNDGKFSNVFIDNTEIDEIVGVVKKFTLAKREPSTCVPEQ